MQGNPCPQVPKQGGTPNILEQALGHLGKNANHMTIAPIHLHQ